MRAACLLLLAATAAAQDKPQGAKPAAKADPMEAEAESIRRSVAAGQWKSGKLAIDKFFAAHGKNPQVLAHVAGIESDLEKCLFRLSGPSPTPLQLLGRGATKLDVASCRAEFFADTLEQDAGWRAVGGVRSFDVLFDGEVSVSLEPSDAVGLMVLLGFDSETRLGFGFGTKRSTYSLGYETTLYSIDLKRAASDPLTSLGRGPGLDPEYDRGVRYSLSPTRATIEVQYRKDWHLSPGAQSFNVTPWKKGYVAITGPNAAGKPSLRIEGKLDSRYLQRTLAEADSRRFREWSKANWDRTKALPASVLALENASGGWHDDVPSGCPPEWRGDLIELQRVAFDDPEAAVKSKPVLGLVGPAADWQDALFAFASHRSADAEAAARRAIAAAAEFGPAYAIAGRALLRRGDDAGAVPLLEEARRRAPKFAPAYDGLAIAALRAGDADRMRSVLTEAAANGVATATTAALRTVAMRLSRGPDWKKRFDVPSANYAVSGDTSLTVCNEVAKTLEEAADVYRRQFRPRTTKTRARVRVFSGFESYAEYVSEFGANPSNSLGMYLPSLRELCVWLHDDRSELQNTIRHEGFHQYLHDFLDDAPIWFNEGYAEFFGFSRRQFGKAVVGQVDEDQGAAAKRLLPKFTPLADLFLMRPDKFMENAGVHYVQSWAVIHLLRDPQATQFNGVLDRYFEAMLAGKSQKEAYDAVLLPVLPQLQPALKAHVEALPSR